MNIRDTDTALRRLIDLVWQTATDSTEVPSHQWADELLAKWRAMPQPPANSGPLAGVFLVRPNPEAAQSMVKLPPQNIETEPNDLRLACDAVLCPRSVTHRWAPTNKRRAFKFCQHHSEKHLMGAGFEVRPDGWDR